MGNRLSNGYIVGIFRHDKVLFADKKQAALYYGLDEEQIDEIAMGLIPALKIGDYYVRFLYFDDYKYLLKIQERLVEGYYSEQSKHTH